MADEAVKTLPERVLAFLAEHGGWDAALAHIEQQAAKVEDLRDDVALLKEELRCANLNCRALERSLAEAERDAALGREIAAHFLPVMEAMRPLVLNLERLKEAATMNVCGEEPR